MHKKAINNYFDLNLNFKNNLFLLLILSTIVRIPFIFNNYGHEEDSWGIVVAVWQSIETGIYEPSRLPGHPVAEAMYLIAPYAGPFFYNTVSLMFSIVAIGYFAAILNKLKLRNPIVIAYAFSFTPVVFISSTYTIDYMISLAFILASFYYLLNNKHIVSALLLGLAIGSRITHGIFLLPFAYYIFRKENKSITLKYTLISLMIGLACFIPVIQQYGLSFFMYYDQFPYPNLPKLMYKASIGVWGVPGVLYLGVVVSYIIINRKKVIQLYSENKITTKICIGIILLFIISYLRLPQKSGYMIPAVPFILILISIYGTNKLIRIAPFIMLTSAFLLGINLSDSNRGSDHSNWAIKHSIKNQEVFFDLLQGPALNDYSKRKNKEAYCNQILNKAGILKDSTLIIAGWYYNQLLVQKRESGANTKSKFVFYISEDSLIKSYNNNYKIFYLQEQAVYNNLYSGITTTEKYASELK